MKNIFFLLVVLVLASCNSNNQFKISGVVEGAEGVAITLKRMDLDKNVVIESRVLGSNGRFSFSNDRLIEPTFFILELDNKGIILLGDTTEHIEVNTQKENYSKEYSIANSMGSAQIRILNQRLLKTKQVTDSLTEKYQNSSDLKVKADIERVWIEEMMKQKKFIGDFVMEHPRSFASYYSLFQKLNDEYVLDVSNSQDQVYFATLATSLNILYPEAARVKQLYNMVLREKQRAASAELTKTLMSIDPVSFPDIIEKNIAGKEVALSSLKGKLVLLSFWASFDAPSRQFNKELKKVYKKYKGRGLEIYQVSLDKSKVLWEKAIKEDQLPWINVSDLKYTQSTPAITYNVKELPTMYLISKKGEIVGKNLNGSLLEEKINKYLN